MGIISISMVILFQFLQFSVYLIEINLKMKFINFLFRSFFRLKVYKY